MNNIKSGQVNTFEKTGVGDRATSKSTGPLQTPKIVNAPGFGKSKPVK